MPWDTILIQSPFGIKLDKEGVYRYYGDPLIANALLEDLKNKNAIVVYKFDKGEVLRRHPPKSKDFLKIDKFLETPDKPEDLTYHTARRAVEFHKVFGNKTDELVIDIDPGEKIKPSFLKSVVLMVVRQMKKIPHVYDVEVRYSGGRGYYVIGKLDKKINIASARQILKAQMNHILSSRVYIGAEPPGPYEIKLDLTAMKPGGSIRALYSLNLKTGLASVKVPISKLHVFDPARDANPLKISRFPNIIKVKE